MRARRTTYCDAATQEEKHGILLGETGIGDDYLSLPCGKCVGCRMAYAKSWALRCQLELQQHDNAAFTTTTYDDAHLPATLEKRHFQLWLKRLRARAIRSAATKSLRFFGCGEYGETNQRPHYHAIIFGLGIQHADLIDSTWGMGLTATFQATPASIAYTAGYTSKKQGWQDQRRVERVDPDTGEVYYWQPPFMQMSRRPGLADHARAFAKSWRLYAIHQGHKMAVPRYLHNAWKAQATPLEQEELFEEKLNYALTRDTSPARLNDALQIVEAEQRKTRDKRKL